ncbi:hypothetical protein EH183_04365 [Streptomyces sp. CB01881]|nr:hypothetical protein C2142_04350 [Streptomyces sp. CB01881]TYC76809.1 hypothetical protein EH183_04365 [Streptomyces sp. CB01881]
MSRPSRTAPSRRRATGRSTVRRPARAAAGRSPRSRGTSPRPARQAWPRRRPTARGPPSAYCRAGDARP